MQNSYLNFFLIGSPNQIAEKKQKLLDFNIVFDKKKRFSFFAIFLKKNLFVFMVFQAAAVLESEILDVEDNGTSGLKQKFLATGQCLWSY